MGKTLEELGVNGRLLEVLYYLCQGFPNSAIADVMCLAEGTVRKDYVSRLLKQFNVKNRTQLVVAVAQMGIAVPKPKPRQPLGKEIY